MAGAPLHIDVSKKDQEELRKVTKGGVQQVRVVLRALALLQLAEHTSAPQIALVIPLTLRRFDGSAIAISRLDWMAPCMRNSAPVPARY